MAKLNKNQSHANKLVYALSTSALREPPLLNIYHVIFEPSNCETVLFFFAVDLPLSASSFNSYTDIMYLPTLRKIHDFENLMT